MSISKEKKIEVIKSFSLHEKDTGSAEVQIAVISERINNLKEHFETHKKDVNSRRGLLRLISRRRKLLDYLKRTNNATYLKLLKDLNLRH